MTRDAEVPHRSYPDWLPEQLEPVVARLARVDDAIGEMGDLAGHWSLDALELKQLRRSDGRYRTVVGAVRPIPPAISLLFSEAIGHLRASLDNVVWHLVTANRDVLDDQAARAVALPIYDDPGNFSTWATKIRKRVPELGEETSLIYERVHALQPFADAGRIPSVSPLLAAMMGVAVEEVHPLLLLQAYSNADKHRAITLTVGRMITTTGVAPIFEQDRRFRTMDVGSVVAPDGGWGTPVPIEAQPAVMVERPIPWFAAVSPAAEVERLRDWVRLEAIPRLVTGASAVGKALPLTIDLGDTGEPMADRLSNPSRPSAQERLAAINAERYVRAMTRAVKFPELVEAEFDD